jgi:hypothetical protein
MLGEEYLNHQNPQETLLQAGFKLGTFEIKNRNETK